LHFSYPHLPRLPHSFPTRRSSDLLAVMAPIGVTVYAFNWLFEGIDAILGPTLSKLLGRTFPTVFQEEQRIPGLGFAATIILLFLDRKSTRLNSSHVAISYAVFCLK